MSTLVKNVNRLLLMMLKLTGKLSKAKYELPTTGGFGENHELLAVNWRSDYALIYTNFISMKLVKQYGVK